jgi:choline kinase
VVFSAGANTSIASSPHVRALILAAGYGNRMRPLTDRMHKTMLQVGGKAVIGGILEGLRENGVNDVCVVTGYRADELEAYLREHYAGFVFQFVRNERFRETNRIHEFARQYPAKTCIVHESFIVFANAHHLRAVGDDRVDGAVRATFRPFGRPSRTTPFPHADSASGLHGSGY